MSNFRPKCGFSALAATLSVALVLSLGLVLISQVLSSRNASKSMEAAFTGTQIAEAGIQKAIYCLNATVGTNCGGSYGATYAGESNVAFNGGKFTTAVSGSGATRTVTATGTTGSGQAKIVAADVTTIPPTDATDFTYALQSGDGGAYLSNNSTVQGTLYTAGDIVCQGTTAVIDGDAYNSASGGKIDSCKVKYYGHADKILNAYITKDAYYKNDPADIAGTTVKGSKFANSSTPTPKDLPAVNLTFWETAAAAGGTIVGDYHPADNSNLGPVKITGDLVLDNNVDVILKGPVWVKGNITTSNNSTITLDPAYGAYSTVILADDPNDRPSRGKVYIENGTGIFGSGNPLSHILIATTNSSTNDEQPAMSIKNNASGAIFFALNGTMRMYNNAGAKSLAGKRLFLEQNASVSYLESEMSDAHFSNSPSATWRLKSGTWHEVK